MKVKTRNTLYTILDMGDGAFSVSGHEKYCPKPTLCTLLETPSVGKRMVIARTADGFVFITTPVVELS